MSNFSKQQLNRRRSFLLGSTFDVNFVSGRYKATDILAGFDDLFTFTRASTARYVDKEGVVKSAAIDEARFDRDGLLIEEARTNIFPFSEVMSSLTLSGVTTNPNVGLAPDGTFTADEVVENGISSIHGVNQSIIVVGATNYIYSGFFKAGTLPYVCLYSFHAGGDDHTTFFDLENGVIISSTALDEGMEYVGNGWYRCWHKVVNSTDLQTRFWAILSETGESPFAFVGDGTGSAFMWGLQVEEGDYLTSYIPTTASTATRSADACSIGDLETADWFNHDEGTFVIIADVVNTETNRGPLQVKGAADFDGFGIRLARESDNEYFIGVSSRVNGGNLNSDTAGNEPEATDGSIKVAASYDSNGYVYMSVNGGDIVSDTTNILSLDFDDMLIMQYLLSGSDRGNASGFLKRLAYLPYCLTGDDLKDLTL